MTSLFSRLQKLNKEATPGQWVVHGSGGGDEWVVAEDGPTVAHTARATNAALIVECRNSLPAVLNLIEATRQVTEETWFLIRSEGSAHALNEALAVFVTPEGDRSTMSGQEEPR